jgi:PTH1 family peptidyl-tRNA hydrolase
MLKLSSLFSRRKIADHKEMSAYLIVGLGNPGPQYALTRHNIGFWVIDELASRLGVRLKEIKFESYFTRASLGGEGLLLAKPLTFMNRSGVAVRGLMRHFSFTGEQILIVYDDLDLPPGRIRMRPTGGSGGHKGVSSIIAQLGSEGFPRLRIGIGRRGEEEKKEGREQQVVSHVLSPFSPEEEVLIGEAVQRAADGVEVFLQKGIGEAMSRFNASS